MLHTRVKRLNKLTLLPVVLCTVFLPFATVCKFTKQFEKFVNIGLVALECEKICLIFCYTL